MKLFDVTVNENEKRNWKDFWDIEYETDDKIILISKESFHIEKNTCDYGDYEFDYHLVLKIEDNYEILDADEFETDYKIRLELYLIPDYNYINKKILNKYGISKEYFYLDILQNLNAPILANDTKNISFEPVMFSNLKELSNILDYSEVVINIINNLQGFYMDCCKNKIGTTNWDLLHSLLFDVNPFAVSLQRIITKEEN